MFVSHLSSFLFYLYVSASVQRKNRLARDKSFLAIPTMPWFTGRRWFVLQQVNTVTTMAADGGNAPVTPHTRHCASFQRVRLMGDDPPSKRI